MFYAWYNNENKSAAPAAMKGVLYNGQVYEGF